MRTVDPLSSFLPAVQAWFKSALGEPTPAQSQGWPAIAAGQNTLILAPTGSGKTLAAFLACLDGLWRQETLPNEVRVLYVSPLKALNNDIYRNLKVPLQGVAETAERLGCPLPEIRVALRTGDTPATERQQFLRKPAQILITTPESLHLLLTSRARETLRGVTHCIVDEIHALCPNKRGVFLSLLLERLASLNRAGDFVRIGLSATQRPLEEVARYLGGFTKDQTPRPVTIVDAGLRKNLDLQVVSPIKQFGATPERSIWPSIYRLLRKEIADHRSTIVFANNRRAVERITCNLNEESDLARAHHGSVALEVRQATEQALKEGTLPAVVATASLELGIDMGAVDLVCQIESPGSVARGLQRVGRAGHLVGQTSKGRLIPKTLPDLLDQAVLAAEIVAGRVEPLHVPRNCLDVLAQQIVAMVGMEPWDVAELFAVIRHAYPFRDLTAQAFETVLEMISGRYRFTPVANASGSPHTLTALQPRVSWDRVHNRLLPLPGSQRLALMGGGTIPDTGQYAAYTTNGTRIGELDEEFIYERRIGDTFLLGTNAWRLEDIQADRVIVVPASGAPAMTPFWRGEKTGRSFDLGLAQGKFLHELSQRISDADCRRWLQETHHLDDDAARNLMYYVRRQLERTSYVPTDKRIIIEASRDQLGDWQVLILTTFGGRMNFSLRLAVENLLRKRLGYGPQCLHHDDGVLIRLTDTAEPVLDLLEGLTAENAESLVLEELADSALFALRFRQNAARALLFPRLAQGKRAPLWLQRLRGRDLLQVARKHPDFPIVIETFRECLHDHLDVPHLQQLLTDIREGRVEVTQRRLETPSPFAATLLFAFTMEFMYEFDDAEGNPTGSYAQLDRSLLEQLVAPSRPLVDPRAVSHVDGVLRGLGRPPRSATEMAERLRKLGDVAPAELEGPMHGFLKELEADGRVTLVALPSSSAPRWVLTEEAETYRRAFGLIDCAPVDRQAAAVSILHRFLETHALVGLQDILDRYPFEHDWSQQRLEEWASAGRVVRVEPQTETATTHWAVPANFEQVQRSTLAVLRREILTCPSHQFVNFVLDWQGLSPCANAGADQLEQSLSRLQSLYLPAELWESSILPARLPGYQPRWLDDALGSGHWLWTGRGGDEPGAGNIALLNREAIPRMGPPTPSNIDTAAERVLDCLRTAGALFVTDICQQTQLDPSIVRKALWQLVRMGLVTNDQYSVVRRGEVSETRNPERRARNSRMRSAPRSALRAPRSALYEGRWSLIAWAAPSVETQAVFQASILLQRYGIAARELALLDSNMPPWRILYEVLSRMELSGEARRGYFVEGLSGAQFALPQAVQRLQDLALPSTATAPVVMLHSLDPANLFGAGAPFEIPQPFMRRAGNWIALRAGRPILLVEQHGRRLTSLPGVAHDEITKAIACLPTALDGRANRGKLTVEEYNGQPATTSDARALLESAGFVRDYQAMTLYAVCK